MTRASGFWNSFSRAALDLLYPSKCGLCGDWADTPICETCRGQFRLLDSGIVRFYDQGALDYQAAVFAYEGRAAQAVRRLKYSRITGLAAPLALELGDAAERWGLLEADLFVPIPIHWSRRSWRGFNQSELLCERLPADRMSQRTVLLRTRATRPQVGLTREERLSNLAGAFAARPEVAGKRVLLIDDVVTTLGTARECASALKAAGAAEVGVLALCGEAEPRS